MKRLFLILLFIAGIKVFAQAENVPFKHDVYTFLHEMKVKGILGTVHYESPNLAYAEVRKMLNEISKEQSKLSRTEKSLFDKFYNEFIDSEKSGADVTSFFGGPSFFSETDEIFSQKMKYVYKYDDSLVTLRVETEGHLQYGHSFKSEFNNALLYDIGWRFRGTLMKNLGYYLNFNKGLIQGSRYTAALIRPSLQTTTKFVMAQEEISNYDFTDGYLKYFYIPNDDFSFAVQIGREATAFGYGYSSRLLYSGNGPNMDFLKFQVRYGVVNFYSLHASIPGDYLPSTEDRYTKYLAMNRLTVSIPHLFDFSLAESIIYSDRGIELGYFNPLIFYKFIEQSLQDRDNAIFSFEGQLNFIPDWEIQASVILDEVFDLHDFDDWANKTAYQLGAFWYSPFGIDDLSWIGEFTRIRPYVYTHRFDKSRHTIFGTVLGHTAGPNSEQYFTQLAYNFSDRLRGEVSYKLIRSGENVYDNQGNMLINYGGDPQFAHEITGGPEFVKLLDGIRIDNHIYKAKIRWEPVRELFFDFVYQYRMEENLDKNSLLEESFAYIQMFVEY